MVVVIGSQPMMFMKVILLSFSPSHPQGGDLETKGVLHGLPYQIMGHGHGYLKKVFQVECVTLDGTSYGMEAKVIRAIYKLPTTSLFFLVTFEKLMFLREILATPIATCVIHYTWP